MRFALAQEQALAVLVEINRFAARHKDFEKRRLRMIPHLVSGRANTLLGAYRLAKPKKRGVK